MIVLKSLSFVAEKIDCRWSLEGVFAVWCVSGTKAAPTMLAIIGGRQKLQLSSLLPLVKLWIVCTQTAVYSFLSMFRDLKNLRWAGEGKYKRLKGKGLPRENRLRWSEASLWGVGVEREDYWFGWKHNSYIIRLSAFLLYSGIPKIGKKFKTWNWQIWD